MSKKNRKNNRNFTPSTFPLTLFELETERTIFNPHDKLIALKLDELIRDVIAVQGGLR